MSESSYEQIIFQINNLLKQETIYPKYMQAIAEGKNDFKISQVYTKKNYNDDWIDFIEECLIPLDTIVRNPRKFIVIEEDIVDVSLARSISVESVKHLAQHTNLISSVKSDGTVIPSKILNTSKEESYEIYENRFIYTLLLKTRDFINQRFELIKNALMQSGAIGIEIKSDFNLDGAKIDYNLGTNANFPFDAAFKKKGDGLSDVERITRINQIFQDFLSSAFAREMRTSAPVRPPITRTNVILKDPNFKKALLLWQFVESNEKMQFKVDVSTETAELSPVLAERYRGLVFLNTVLLQSIASIRKGEDALIKENEDKTIADEYVTKNIDDYVPDDFPQLKMDLNEVRRIYYRVPGHKTLNLTEIAKMNAALDRVLRQYRINQARENSITQQRLIAEQLREEAEAKRLALREARDLERKKKQEAARLRLEKRRIEAERALELRKAEDARIAAEKRAAEERERIEAERIRQAEKAKREEEERRAEEMRLAQEEAYRIKLAEEKASAERINAELTEYKKRLEIEERRIEEELKEREQKYWKKQRELAIRLIVDADKSNIKEKESERVSRMLIDEKEKLKALEHIESSLRSQIIVEHYRAVEDILSQAKGIRSEEEIKEIRNKLDKQDERRERRAALGARIKKLTAEASRTFSEGVKFGLTYTKDKLKENYARKKKKERFFDEPYEPRIRGNDDALEDD